MRKWNKKTRNIKELLEIDIDFLYQNSQIKSDSKTDKNDNRNYLLFDLNSKFLELFDHFQISMFHEKALHLEFISQNPNLDRIERLIELIVNEYGADENNQSASDWKTSKYLSWWFKNDIHDRTYDDPENTDELYYGITIDGMKNNLLNLVLIDYKNIDPKLNKKNWLQHGV